MANNYPYVTNDFLEKLFKTQQRVIFVRITSLFRIRLVAFWGAG